MKQNNKKAVIYCRVATEDQVNGSSLAIQENVCRSFARAKGYDVREVIAEVVSGVSDKRTGFNRLVKLVKNKKVGIVCIQKIDRLSRNSEQTNNFLALLKKCRVELVCASNPSCELIEAIMCAHAQYSSQIRRERILAGLARKKSLLRSGASSTI